MIKKSLLITSWIVSCLFSLTAFAQEKIVISQVYGGGGNSGAPYTHDFIELFNAGTSPVSLGGLSLQYASATGTGNFGANSGQLTELPNVTLQPGQYYLIQQAGGTTGTALPTPDLIDATPISLAASAGKIVLVTGSTSLGCNGGSSLCNSEATARILDLVGYGNANYFEGRGATPAPNNITAVLRVANGCTDTNSNNADFATGAPTPRNSASAINACGVVTPVELSASASANPATVVPGGQTLFTVTVTPASTGISVTGDLTSIGGTAAQPLYDNATNGDATAGDNIYSYRATVTQTTTTGTKTLTFNVSDANNRTATATTSLTVQSSVALTPVYTIQGSSTASTLVGQTVTTQGVVVGDFQASGQLNGFFIQDATGDGNTATSDGIFVLSRTAVNAGQIVKVTGPVREVFNQTQIGGSGDNVIVEVQTGTATISPSIVSLPVSSTGVLEQHEGMLVSFPQVLTVSQNFTLARFGEVVLSADLEYPFNEVDGRLYNPTNYIDPTDNPASGITNAENNKAAIVAQQDLHNRSTILLDDASSVQNPAVVPYLGPDNTLRVGSSVNNLTGILNYAFSAYRLQPTVTPAFTYAPRPLDPPSAGNANLKIASFNVLNYFNGNGTGGGFPTPRGANNLIEFDRQRAKIIAALKALNADVVGLIEMENDGDGANSAIADLVKGLNEATASGTYDYIRDVANGGTGTDAIKVAFIYKPGVVTPVGAPMADLASVHNRPPLAQTFKLNNNGEIVTAVINHFKSKGGTGSGADADQRDGQGAFNATRIQQAQALVQFINNTVLPAAGDSDIIILGDLNAYFEEDPIDVLRAAGFVSLFGAESYSYVFDGQSGSLDHALVTPSLEKQFTGGGKWHINADEPIFLDYNTEFKTAAQIADLYTPDAFRSSDHDPVLVGLNLFSPAISFAEATKTISEGIGSYTINLNLSNPTYQETTVTFSLITAGATIADFSTTPAASDKTITLTIPSGSSTASFSLNITDDQIDELDEKITFTITNVSSGLKPASQLTTVITIEDNDVPSIRFSQPVATVEEKIGTYTITLPLSIEPVTDQTVVVSIKDNEFVYGKNDYTTIPDGAAGQFVLPVPAGSQSVTFTVVLDKNAVKKKNPQDIVFSLVNPSGGLTVGTPQAFTLTVFDDKRSSEQLRQMLLSVWPNPTSGLVNIVTEMQNETMEATLRSPEGEVVFSGLGTAANLSQQISHALQSRRSGLYHLQMIVGDEVVTTRILKF